MNIVIFIRATTLFLVGNNLQRNIIREVTRIKKYILNDETVARIC